jgi:hypothetical protein
MSSIITKWGRKYIEKCILRCLKRLLSAEGTQKNLGTAVPDNTWVWTATVEWYWRENRRTRRKTCPSVTLSTTNPMWTEQSANPSHAVKARWLPARAIARPISLLFGDAKQRRFCAVSASHKRRPVLRFYTYTLRMVALFRQYLLGPKRFCRQKSDKAHLFWRVEMSTSLAAVVSRGILILTCQSRVSLPQGILLPSICRRIDCKRTTHGKRWRPSFWRGRQPLLNVSCSFHETFQACCLELHTTSHGQQPRLLLTLRTKLQRHWYSNSHLPSDRTSYASEISLNFLVASSKLSGFLSGCHFSAKLRYLKKAKQIHVILSICFAKSKRRRLRCHPQRKWPWQRRHDGKWEQTGKTQKHTFPMHTFPTLMMVIRLGWLSQDSVWLQTGRPGFDPR